MQPHTPVPVTHHIDTIPTHCFQAQASTVSDESRCPSTTPHSVQMGAVRINLTIHNCPKMNASARPAIRTSHSAPMPVTQPQAAGEQYHSLLLPERHRSSCPYCEHVVTSAQHPDTIMWPSPLLPNARGAAARAVDKHCGPKQPQLATLPSHNDSHYHSQTHLPTHQHHQTRHSKSAAT